METYARNHPLQQTPKGRPRKASGVPGVTILKGGKPSEKRDQGPMPVEVHISARCKESKGRGARSFQKTLRYTALELGTQRPKAHSQDEPLGVFQEGDFFGRNQDVQGGIL